jgi:secreted trypsin-like serine protease
MHIGKARSIAIVLTAASVTLLGVAQLGAITFGWQDNNKHPNVGAMFYQRTDASTPLRLCSGTLISDDVFLTASHCTAYLDRLDAQGLLAWVGVSFNSAPPHHAIIHGTHYTNPDYYSLNGIDAGDVGVVVLDTVPGYEPAELPAANMFNAWYGVSRRAVKDLRFTAVGFGSLEPTFGGGPPVFVPSFGYRYYAYSSFAAMDKVWLHLQANEATGDGGTCYGDSGGPNFLWQDGQETNIIAGVTVKGDAMCMATNVIYRLDTPTARRFLENFVDLP